MTLKLWALALAWLQRRCRHGDGWVIADVLEGAYAETQVQWCRACGALRIVDSGRERESRIPDPVDMVGWRP